MIRRVSDIILCLIIGLLLLPVCLVIILAIKIEDGGRIIYSGPRTGRYGKIFNMFKFRTMKDQVNLTPEQIIEFHQNFKLDDDPRISRSGRWLRRYSLDEIPQLINIFKGEMSVIGPRPKLPEEINLYETDREELLSVLPGLTGYWQVHRKHAHSDAAMKSMDMFYIRNRSFLMDLKILGLTLVTVCLKRNL